MTQVPQRTDRPQFHPPGGPPRPPRNLRFRNSSNRWKAAHRLVPVIGNWLTLASLAVLSVPVFAQNPPVCGTNEMHHLGRALAALNMTTNDLEFDKDHGEPRQCLPWVRDALKHPLMMTRKGDELLKAAAEGDEAIWNSSGKLLGVGEVVTDLQSGGGPGGRPDWRNVDRNLFAAINEFSIGAQLAGLQMDLAFSNLDHEARGWMAATMFSQLLRADRGDVKATLQASGVSDPSVSRAIAEEKAFDPEPSVTNFLAAAAKIEPAFLLLAGRAFQGAVRELARVAATVTNWPSERIRFESGCGPIIILPPGDQVVTNGALLILSREGNTTYKSASSTPSTGPGAANGLLGRPLSAIIDLGGDDRYEGGDGIGPGGALFGVSVMYDLAGDDVYKARNLGQGAAFFGISWVEDAKGEDRYEAWGYSQGAAACGFALLRDREGNDLYNVGVCGQGFAAFQGVGLLVDDAGNDRFLAGNREVDWDRNSGRFLSLSQGFSIGIRGFAGGGVAALIDRGGNDTYAADVYGQGSAYWYSAGFLLDTGGNDNYTLYQYGQGSGIHLALGLLADLAGNDRYTGYILSQGNGHDFGVGLLFDHAGDDTYAADHHSQGRALNNGLALLLDSAGDDGYFARQNHRAQGIGNNGGYREYGSLALLLDLDGRDQFSCGAKDGDRLLRPLYGIVYDASTDAPGAPGGAP